MADALIHAVQAPTWACAIAKQYGTLRSTFPFWKTMLEKKNGCILNACSDHRPHSSQNIRLCNYLLPIWFCMKIKSILFLFFEIPHGVMDKDSFCNYAQTIIFFGSKRALHQSDSGQTSSEFRLVLSLLVICVFLPPSARLHTQNEDKQWVSK